MPKKIELKGVLSTLDSRGRLILFFIDPFELQKLTRAIPEKPDYKIPYRTHCFAGDGADFVGECRIIMPKGARGARILDLATELRSCEVEIEVNIKYYTITAGSARVKGASLELVTLC